jgi:FMN phosphatase YigB (HAD superfamily)
VKQTVIFDIDGTLADIRHRRGFLEGERPDWNLFNAAMGDDTPNVPVVTLYKSLWETGQYDMVLASGRNERHRRVTEQWLIWNEIPFERILLRTDKDSRADHIIKQEILDMLLAEGRQIAFTVDDRQQVVDMWRRNGITCLQCDVGDF